MKKESENYLRVSLADLESSRILYESQKYPQAIFFLQQSIEKTTKGITGIFEKNHRTLDLYKKLTNKKVKEEIKILGNIKIDNEEKLLGSIWAIKSLLSEIDSGKSNLKVGRITIPKLILQQILFGHVNSTRYPEEDYNPLTKYTKDYFLIKHYDKIYDLQKECLEECFKFFSHDPFLKGRVVYAL